MFEKEYKNTFDEIKPQSEVLNNSIKTALEYREKNIHNAVRRLIVCGLAAVLIVTSLLMVLNFLNDDYEINGIRPANNIDDIKKFIEANEKVFRDDYWTIQLETTVDETAREDNIKYNSIENTISESESKNEYSDTNNQVAGVQEADIVKTDGEYIYCLNVLSKTLNVMQANNGIVTSLSSVKINVEQVFDMLLVGNYISVIGVNRKNTQETVALYYDISDKTKPVYSYALSQDGYYTNCRAVGDTVIVITNKLTGYYDEQDVFALPKANGKEIIATDIWLPDAVCGSSFTILTSHTVKNNAGEFNSAISVLGASNIIYASKDNLYLSSHSTINPTDSTSERYKTKTDIYRITLNDNTLNVNGCGTVEGTVKDQFSFDEKDGILRIATNIEYMVKIQMQNGHHHYKRERMENKVFCLDEKLNIIGESEPIGAEEEIKSVRYIGNTAYVVTFMQTDPLYAIDLDDPKKPKVLSELKITGFSSYMQQYADNLLLGIGFEANSLNGVATGLKLTMFDITDSTNVYDVSSLKYEWNNNYSSTEATYNHKALLINESKSIIAIPLIESGAYIDNANKTLWKNELSYVFFEFDGKSLKEKKKLVINDFLNITEIKDSSMRGIFINDYAYVICSEGIVSVSLESYAIVDTLAFK